jgi:predicted ribosomally synthesized peptide with SipW-like signal peptide
MNRTTTRAISVIAALVSLAGVTLLIGRASNAAFTDTTSTTGSFSAGQVELVDDDAGSATFTVTDMVPGPGSTVEECITTTYQGTTPDPGAVHLYSGGLVDTGLAPHLDVTVEEGTGGSSASCAGFTPGGTIYSGTLSGFDTAHTSYGTGVGTWNPASTPESTTYRFTATLGSDTPNAAQSTTAAATFVWEVQS